ncbi:amidophosphoribosyltransferase [Harryflintia acetispora]|uniref:amidophosphoribosyltransferase n=1 Tax=Harryflintia acetispora TaxID=1849041 RepID=UPI00189A0CD7
MDGKLHEECGVFGIRTTHDEAAGITYNALLALQHRGQEGAGIAVLRDQAILYHKDVGLVSEVFTPQVLNKIPAAHLAIGHVRYSTTGGNRKENTQPVVTEYLKGRIAISHNGNIINAAALREKLRRAGCDFNATTDSEVVSSLIAYEILQGGGFEEAIVKAAKQLRGAYTLLVLGSGDRLCALRDPSGFRPLCLGRSNHGWAVASESCALDSAGFDFLRDVQPGELITIDGRGRMSSRMALGPAKLGMCLFEYVYFARTDSVIDSLSVYEARYRMGEVLAREHPAKADVVCGVPDSGLEAAMGYAAQSGLPCVPGFVKNRYIGRSFIFPSQAQRDMAVRLKLSPLRVNVAGKRVVLVDDSIVRGTTGAKIVSSLKAAGAREVHLRISSPPFYHTCYFGTDIGDEENLIANRLSHDEITTSMGADSLGYISIEGLKSACSGCSLPFCDGCFTGRYPLDAVEQSKTQFEQ